MHRITLALLATSMTLGIAHAQSAQSLSATLGVYVFPASGQEASQQSQDEAACYEWAVGNTGADPFEAQKKAQQAAQQAEQQSQQAKQATQGAGAKGALGGAAMGALIGEIADDDASKGAAYGAAAGGIMARRGSRRQSKEAQQQIEQQSSAAQQATAEQISNFKKAFSVCLEAKDYLVKY